MPFLVMYKLVYKLAVKITFGVIEAIWTKNYVSFNKFE